MVFCASTTIVFHRFKESIVIFFYNFLNNFLPFCRILGSVLAVKTNTIFSTHFSTPKALAIEFEAFGFLAVAFCDLFLLRNVWSL